MNKSDKMNDEMREAFCNWLETEHGVKPIEGIAIDALANMTNPQLFAGFQAAYQLQQEKIDALMQNTESMSQTNAALIKKLDMAVEALESIARYDPTPNWQGAYAQTALNQIKGKTTCSK